MMVRSIVKYLLELMEVVTAFIVTQGVAFVLARVVIVSSIVTPSVALEGMIHLLFTIIALVVVLDCFPVKK